MSSSVLGNLVLGYQLVWDRQRQPRAVQLFINEAREHAAVDAAHLLAVLDDAWFKYSPTLVLSAQSKPLLFDLLQHATPDGPWITVQQDQLADAQTAALVQAAHARGLQLLWRGKAGQAPESGLLACFARGMFTLAGEPARPGLDGQICEAISSRTLAADCLDRQAAWGVAGWPSDGKLPSGDEEPQMQRFQPSRQAITALLKAVDADASMEVIEHTLAEEPVLVYRFLLYTNSASLGLRNPAESLRHGLMLLGLSTLQRWLTDQLPHATSDPDLKPVRDAIVLRARLAEVLLDAGGEDTLRREVYLCGLLSQIDLVLGEPLASALHRLPLSERIISAVLRNSGPYTPYLEIATALEWPQTAKVPDLCEAHGVDIADVNRALLRVLSHLQPQAAGRR